MQVKELFDALRGVKFARKEVLIFDNENAFYSSMKTSDESKAISVIRNISKLSDKSEILKCKVKKFMTWDCKRKKLTYLLVE